MFFEFLWTYLYQNCQANLSFVKICYCYTVLKEGNNFLPPLCIFMTDFCEIWYKRTPQNNVKQLPVSWKPGSARHTLRRRMEPTAPFIVHFSSDFDQNIDKSHVQKNLISGCAYCENQRSDIYIYIAYIMVWMNWCCCFTHWVPDLCEIVLENCAQIGADCLSVSCISTHGRQYIRFGPTLRGYRKIGTFSTAELAYHLKIHALRV